MRLFTWNEKLGDPECPYLIRWAINFGPLGSVRLHHWVRSDDKRHAHDHPSNFITLILKGEYEDWTQCPPCRGTGCFLGILPVGCTRCHGTGISKGKMKPGSIRFRRAEHRHIVNVIQPGCWTLLYFFPKRRDWGFWVPRKSDGTMKFKKANKYFLEHGHHPCDQL